MKNQDLIPFSRLNQVNMKNLLLFCLATFFTLNYAFAQEKSMGCTPTVVTGDPIQIGGGTSCPGGAGQIQFNGTNYQVWDPASSSWITFGSAPPSPSLWTQVGTSNDIYNTLQNRVGIGLTAPNHKLHLEDFLIPDLGTAQKIDFGTNLFATTAYGLNAIGQPLNASQKGLSIAVNGETSSNYFNGGEAQGRLAVSKSFSGDAAFIGVGGYASSTTLSNSNDRFSRVVGGDFAVLATTNLSLSASNFWIAGMKAELQGNIDNNPANGAVAAVIGRDLSTGTAKSWAGYFEGDGYFSDKVVIGRKTFPATIAGTCFPAPGFDVSTFQLFVEGGILTEKMVLAQQSCWADYVFADDYNLLSLEEVEQHIEMNGHLPNTPSAAEVEEQGMDIAEIAINQQEKIEELFLHVIELNKQVKALQAENAALKTATNH